MRQKRPFVIIAFLFTALTISCFEAQALSSDDKANLNRTEDPIILKGSDLPGLVGLSGERLRVMAVRNGDVIPVPFQIDPCDDKGRMIFRKVKLDGRFIDNPKLDASRPLCVNDELVFMSGDMGDRAGPGMLPPGVAVEVEVTDPLDNSRAWVYVVYPSGRIPLPSDKIYVRYLPEQDTVVSTNLNFGFTDPEYPAVLTFLALGDGINNPDGLVDLLDRFRMKLSITLKWDLATIVRRETELRQSVALYNEGPIRVMRLLRYSVLLVGNIPSPTVDRLNTSYRSCISFPNDVNVPFRPGLIVDEGTFDLHLDLTREAVGTRIYHPLFPEPVVVDGKMDKAEQEFAIGFPLWAVMANPYGGIVGVVNVKEEFLDIQGVSPEFTYLDDASIRTPGEDDPGAYGRIGWRFSGLNNLPGGNYEIDLILYGLAGRFETGDEKQFLNLVHHPVNIKTRVLESPLE